MDLRYQLHIRNQRGGFQCDRLHIKDPGQRRRWCGRQQFGSWKQCVVTMAQESMRSDEWLFWFWWFLRRHHFRNSEFSSVPESAAMVRGLAGTAADGHTEHALTRFLKAQLLLPVSALRGALQGGYPGHG